MIEYNVAIPYSQETRSAFLDEARQPLAIVRPGELVTFETMNAFSEETNTEEELNHVISRGYHHPFTGPVHIEGAVPNMTLAVHVHNIELNEHAYTCISRSSGALKGRFPFRHYKKVLIEDGHFNLSDVRLKVAPSLGGCGLADPANTRNGATGRHGGNFDFREVGPGSTIYLPIAVEGGLLYVGDLHALQGNGEVSGIALEASGKVSVSTSLHSIEIPGPLIHTEQGLLVVGYSEKLEAAIQVAADHAIQVLSRFLSISEADAYVLLGCTSDVISGHLTGRTKSVAILIPSDVLPWEEALQQNTR